MEAELEKNTEIPKQGVVIPLPVRCGSCYHFKTRRADTYSDTCKNLGIIETGRPCIKYLVNPKNIDLRDTKGKSLAEIVGQVPANGLSALAALIAQERITRDNGYRLGEEVYVRLYSDEYLSNYFRAWIIQADRKRVFVHGINMQFRAEFLQSSVFDGEQFAKKKAALITRKALVDPKLKLYTKWKPDIKQRDPASYINPTIDQVYKITEKPEKKKSIRHTPLTEIITIRRS